MSSFLSEGCSETNMSDQTDLVLWKDGIPNGVWVIHFVFSENQLCTLKLHTVQLALFKEQNGCSFFLFMTGLGTTTE